MSTRKKIQQIYKKKKELRSNLKAWRDSAEIFIYGAFTRGYSANFIRKNLIKDTNKRRYVPNELLKEQLKTINFIEKKINKNDPSSIYYFVFKPTTSKDNRSNGDVIAKLLNRSKNEKRSNRVINKHVLDFESEEKNKLLEDEKKENPKRLFILVSEHKDSALDHKDYQGRLYFAKDYEKIIANEDEKTRKEIFKRIKEEHMLEFEWVIGKPVWMITRPNCRHFFEYLDTEDVLKHTTKYLLKKHKMKLAVGDRKELQTLKHDTRKQWYTKENVANIIETYKNRLDKHMRMNKEQPCDYLDKAIEKDKLLIEKWKNYYKEIK